MSAPDHLPIFPLNAVLFPLGRLTLRIFEARYLDMIAECMKADAPFGICLIAEGEEVGTPAVPHKVGTEALIESWDMSEPGILILSVRGGRRFHLLDETSDEHGRITGSIKWFAEPGPLPVSEAHQALLPLLLAVIGDAGGKAFPPPHRIDDAAWIGYRYAEFLPIPNLARQRLLELENTDLRLSIIHAYLVEHGLLTPEKTAK